MEYYFKILKFVRPYWKHLALTFIFSLFFAAFSGMSVYLIIPLLDTLFEESLSKSGTEQIIVEPAKSIFPDWISNIVDGIALSFKELILTGEQTDVLIKICMVIFIAFLMKNIFGYLQSYFMAYVEYGSMKSLRDSAYRHLHQLPLSYFKKERVGNLISRFTNDVNKVQESISATFNNLIKEPIVILVFLGIAVGISWQLTIFALVILPISMLFIMWIGLKIRKQSAIVQAKMADITSVLQETISGVKIVKAFGMEKFENRKFEKETRSFLKIMLRIVRIRNASSPITELISVLVGVIIIYYGGSLVLEKDMISASQFMGFLIAIFQMMTPIKELSTVNIRIQEASAAAERIFEILDTEPYIKDSPGAKVLGEFNESIIFENICFKFDDSEELVLDNINFTVRNGDIVALVGPSGGGKSTLVDLVPRFYDPTSGKILIDGSDIRNITIESLRSKMGIVTQETFLFNASIKENIAYGLSGYPIEKIIEAAKTANAHDFIMDIANGYDSVIGERGIKLSGGQRQRLTIARALLKNPEIMIFDEATSALDNESEILVQQAIERLMQNRTTFVIAHRLSTIRNATNILVLDQGKIIQTGTHENLIEASNGLYKKLYDMQFRDF